jgi:exosortase J
VFNFLRLCVLVLYYLVALKIVWLQDKATGGDYVIGACLFTIAATLLILAIRKAGREPGVVESSQLPDPEVEAQKVAHDTRALSTYYPRLAVFVVVMALGSVAYAMPWARSMARTMTGAEEKQQAALTGHFPQQLGAYTLSRTWKEQLSTGVVIYEWAEYVSNNDNGARIQLGISPVLGSHDTTLCHVARGEDAIWQGTVNFSADGRADESFSASLYNDGVSQFMEASTQCTLAGCGEYTSIHSHFGIIFSLPHAGTLLQQPDQARPLPVLLRAETTDVALPKDAARLMLLAELSSFAGQIDLAKLTAEYRSPDTDALPPQ